ncbi:MAG: RNA polymerase factor sigma-54 [Opitutales bacterium]|nr:RNA polymerase factor sigma-54 [Opitutales bacterium]
MDANLQQSQKLEQGLILTQAQRQSLDILQKPVLELQKYVEELLQQNPMLEIEEFEPNEKPQNIGELQDDFEDDTYDGKIQNEQSQHLQSLHDFILNSKIDNIRLGEKLINEARIDASSDDVADAFEFLVQQLDARGFLPENVLELAIQEGFKRKHVEEALDMLQHCEPSGIGARNLKECFLIQLRACKLSESLAYRIIEDNFQLFLKRRVDEIANAEGRTIEAVEKAMQTLAKLNPSPAYEYTVDEENILIADVRFFKSQGQWKVELTNNYIPKLRINSEYRQMMAEGSLDKNAMAYVKEKIHEGKYIIDAIKQRQNTLLKIATVILQHQIQYLENGNLIPMTRQEIADEIGMHPTTIGRAISGKNVETPFGILELKNFFTNSIENDEGDSVSSNTIKEKIQDIISQENPTKPYSDAKISELLQQHGINIARRTVAKYREDLGIATKTLRKRF